MQNLQKRYPPPFRSFERATVRRAQAWIACGRLVYETMTARGYPADRGHVLPLAFDPAVFHPRPPAARTSLIAELGLTPPVVGFVGRLVASKGLDVLMRTLERLPASVPWSLLALGSGPQRATLDAWIARLAPVHRGRVLLARHGEVAQYLAAMDVLVAPSQTTKGWREQFGRMLIEAMACGVPVIASDSGEIPHVVGEAGRIVREDDVEGYARALEDVLTNVATRAAMSERSLERARRYSVAVVARQYRDLYRSVIGQAVSA